MGLTESLFWLKVYPRGDCWEWRGVRHTDGYGMSHWGDPYNWGYAHRHAYELAKGTIPRGLQIDHICGHQWCVRPSHLEAVPQAVNNRRRISRRADDRLTHCSHGHELTVDNTYRRPDGHGECRICREHSRVGWRTRGRVA